MQEDKATPPVMADVLRPQRSAKIKAGMEINTTRIAETPDAKKDAVLLGSPA
jgi:hypothetical protein